MRSVLLLGLLLMSPAFVQAEEIHLQSGKTIIGEVVEETDKQIKINSEGKVFVIKKSMILKEGDGAGGMEFVDMPPIDVYISMDSPNCEKLEQFLQSQRIKYNRYDVGLFVNERRQVDAGGSGGVPFTVIGPYTVTGYHPDGIVYYLKLYRRDLRKQK